MYKFYEKYRYKKTLRGPLATPKYAKEALSDEDFVIEIMKNLLSRVINAEGYSEGDIESYVNMYWDFCRGDLYTDSPVSIKDFDYLFNKIKLENSSMYNKMRRAYKFDGEKPYSEAKFKVISQEIINFISQKHTIENALLYSYRYKEDMKIAASKFNTDGNDLSLEEISKWAILWYLFFRDREHFAFDFDKEGNVKNEKGLSDVDNQYFLPETMVLTEQIWASLEDNSISISEMKSIIDSCKPIIRDEIYAYVQLDGSDYSTLIKVGQLRELKQLLFENATIEDSNIQELDIVVVEEKEEDKIKIEELKENWKNYKNDSTISNSDIDFVKWWANNPDHKINDKDFFENEINLIFFTQIEFRQIIAKILEVSESADLALRNQISRGEADKNIIFAIFDLEDPKVFQLIYQYVEKVEIPAAEIFKTLGISLEDFNFKRNFYNFNPSSFAKKVVAAKKKGNPSIRERILLKIYNYLKEYDPVCGNKKQKFSAYGI